MRKTNQKQIPHKNPNPISVQAQTPISPQKSKQQTPMQSPKAPVQVVQPEIPVLNDEEMKMEMDVEEKKEDIILDDNANGNGEDNKIVNLDDNKENRKPKEKKPYDIDDTIIREITLTGDLHVKLISNVNGYFVDIRKHYKGFPTKKGIRILATKFLKAAEYLKADLKSLIPQEDTK